MPTILERITGRRKETREKQLETYREIVETVAAGTDGDLDLARVEKVLAGAGKNADDLTADAELLVQRRAWAAEAAELPGVEADCRAYEREKSAAQAAWEQAIRDREAAVESFANRILRLMTQQNRAANAKRKLAETCDPSISERLKVAAAELQQVAEQIRGAEANDYINRESQITAAEGRLSAFADQLRELPANAPAEHRARIESQIAATREHVAQQREALDRAKTRQRELPGEIERLNQAKLAP